METVFFNLDQKEVSELFRLLEQEFRIDVGFLRPDDSLYALFSPVSTFNPLAWMIFRGLESDAKNEIGAELVRKRRKRGLPELLTTEPRTFGELVVAWCQRPET